MLFRQVKWVANRLHPGTRPNQLRWTRTFGSTGSNVLLRNPRLQTTLLPHARDAASRRTVITYSGSFQPVGGPPSPSSLGGPRPARSFNRTTKWSRRLFYISLALGTFYALDSHFFASGLARSLRTFATGLLVALDYKLNFRASPWVGGTIEDLHRRSADRLSELLRANGGLYLKIGQAIAMQSAILPPEFQKMFARMFDDAPQDSWKEIEKVIREEFGGKGAEDVFSVNFSPQVVLEGRVGVMERTARASASVAQVHWARLADGREVAVKIQKPEIRKQVWWDLWAWRTVMRIYTWWFDLPLYSLVPFVTERLMLETDFEVEAKNSETMRQLVASEPSLAGRVYIPKVYSDLSSKRVLTTEWIEGVRLWDKEGMTAPWRGGYGNASPGVHGAKLDSPDSRALAQELQARGEKAKLKPERTEWKGFKQRGGLGLSTKEVMGTMIDLFSAQIFRWGVVHCDPHPGNIFVRRLPSGKTELVLIDHGLYVYMAPRLRRQYAEFWKSLMTFDNARITQITREWGIKAADLFASATLMRPYEGGDNSTRSQLLGEDIRGMSRSERHYEMQKRMKAGIRDILAEEENFPRELVFIGRNMRIVQANNQFLGSPVNRIKRMGNWASRAAWDDSIRSAWRQQNVWVGVKQWVGLGREVWGWMLFRLVLGVSDLVFWFFRLKQIVGLGRGMEDELEERMREMAGEFGIELQHEVFEG